MSEQGLLPPYSEDMETSALGGLLISDKALSVVLTEDRLRPAHFWRPRNRVVFTAMVSLLDRGESVDVLTTTEELKRTGHLGEVTKEYVYSLPSMVPSAGNVRQYARRVVELAAYRQKIEAAREILQAASREDMAAVTLAETKLWTDPGRQSSNSPEELANQLFEHIEKGGFDAIPFPLEGLNKRLGGGMIRGAWTVIGGHTSHGKSIFIDQALDHAVTTGASVQLFINEMTPLERAARVVSRTADVPYLRIISGKLLDGDYGRITKALEHMPFPITDAGEWELEDVCHDIRRNKPDVAGIDIVHEFEHEHERDLARFARLLRRTARASGTHILAAVHLNERRNIEKAPPRPVLGDIRGTGMFARAADNVIFTWLDRPEGDPQATLEPGEVILAKGRGGLIGRVAVHLNGNRMRFEPRMEQA